MLNKPFLLRPAAKDYLWGGNRLNNEFAKDIDMDPLAETWECSTHPDGPSIVASGEYEGQSLIDVIKAHPDFLGSHPDTDGELPILIKFIDAKSDLSVQVHPDDEYAFAKENGQRGKTEMWYVLDAKEGTSLVYGLRQTTDKEVIRKAILDGNVEKYLQKVPVKKDDLFYIEAGTIHAIGAGALIAEIQENSNLTYRLYDYDREDKHGNKRELHIDKALDVANLKGMSEPKQPIRVFKYSQGVARELLTRCKYFEVYCMVINTERRQKVTYQADELSFRVLLCVNGCGTVNYTDERTLREESLTIYKGDCLFIPASSVEMNIHGQIKFLEVRS